MSRTSTIIVVAVLALAAATGYAVYTIYGRQNNPVCRTSSLVGKIDLPLPPGFYPNSGGIAYDSAKGKIYLTEATSNSVAVISVASGNVTKNISLDSQPHLLWAAPLVYDPAKGYIYVLNGHGLTIISDSTDSVVGNVTLPAIPNWAAYDPSNGRVYATTGSMLTGMGDKPGTLYAVSDESNSVVGNVTIGYWPVQVTADGRGKLYVLDYVANSTGSYRGAVTVVSDSSNSVVKNVVLSAYPPGRFAGIAYDSRSGYLFLTATITAPHGPPVSSIYVISPSDKVTEIGTSINSVYTSISYDSAKDCVYIADSEAPDIVVVSGGNYTIIQTILFPHEDYPVAPMYFAFNEAAGFTYLSDQGGRVWIILDGRVTS